MKNHELLFDAVPFYLPYSILVNSVWWFNYYKRSRMKVPSVNENIISNYGSSKTSENNMRMIINQYGLSTSSIFFSLPLEHQYNQIITIISNNDSIAGNMVSISIILYFFRDCNTKSKHRTFFFKLQMTMFPLLIDVSLCVYYG